MLEQLKNGVTQKLSEITDIVLFTEPIKQGIKDPCFFVLINDSGLIKEVGRRYRQEINFMIVYYPHEDDLKPREDCEQAVKKLYKSLEYIQTESGLVRSKELKHEFKNNALYFYLSFKIHLFKEREQRQKMQKVKIEVRENG